MNGAWRIAPGAEPLLRAWGDEVVVHHALSNDTHRLTALAGQVLLSFIAAEGGDAAVRVELPDIPEDELHVTLSVLEDLGLVTQC
jgi:hypothetical protein